MLILMSIRFNRVVGGGGGGGGGREGGRGERARLATLIDWRRSGRRDAGDLERAPSSTSWPTAGWRWSTHQRSRPPPAPPPSLPPSLPPPPSLSSITDWQPSLLAGFSRFRRFCRFRRFPGIERGEKEILGNWALGNVKREGMGGANPRSIHGGGRDQWGESPHPEAVMLKDAPETGGCSATSCQGVA